MKQKNILALMLCGVIAALLQPLLFSIAHAADGAIYRTTVREFRTDSYCTKGLPKREVVADGSGNPFIETLSTYVLRHIDTAQELVDIKHTTATAFPELRRSQKHFYEGQSVAGKTRV